MSSICVIFLLSAMVASATCGPISSLVQGTPQGFAAGTVGGGNSPPVYPKTIDELIKVLNQTAPAVVVIDKEFNFIGSKGRDTKIGCKVSKCGSMGQDAYPSGTWCGAKPTLAVTIDTAGRNGMIVRDSKTLVGVGSSAVLRGKGLKIRGKNVIIQNIAITEINPEFIFGGDALDLDTSDQIWIDRVTVSNIGRQFMRAGPHNCGRITISNSFFNGTSAHSSSCNGQHNWGFLFLGSGDQITMMNNNLYHISSRGPKVGGSPTANVLVHAFNNTWTECDGHAFNVTEGGQALIEGNQFNGVRTVVWKGDKGEYLLADESNSNDCVGLGVGRACAPNVFNQSEKPNVTCKGKPVFSVIGAPLMKTIGGANSGVNQFMKFFNSGMRSADFVSGSMFALLTGCFIWTA